MNRHLLVDVSGHGFGHLAQVAPVLNALRERHPGLRLTVRTEIPAAVVRRRVGGDLTVLDRTVDPGLAMHSAFEVDVAESLRRYRAFHADWPLAVERAAAEMAAIAPDLLLADVPYRSLAAAARLGVPALALCSLNWADLFGHYCGEEPGALELVAAMREAYGQAREFLQAEPAMPMSDLANRTPVGPIAALGRRRRAEVDARLGLGRDDRLVLVGLGGVETRLPLARWPRITGVRWLMPAAWGGARPDLVPLESLAMPFLDLLASCDVLLTKTGYGSFVEAACAGVRVLNVCRPDWPEEPYLLAWLERHAACRSVGRAAIGDGAFIEAVEALLSEPSRPPVLPSGVAEAVGRIEALARAL